MEHLIHDPLTLFFAQASAIIVLSRLLGLLLKRIDQPMVIAEITAGILLGPSLLGWLAPEVTAGLFPTDSMGVLKMLSQVGLVFFMFLIGLELDPALLKGRGKASVVISQAGIVVPFTLGSLLALYLFPRLGEAGVPFSSFTLFMGVAMSITAFPVLARILTERRLLRSRVGAVTITCAAVDDVTAWCILAFVVSIVQSAAMSDAVVTTLLSLVYIAVMFVVVRPVLGRLAARGAGRESLTQNTVAATFLLLLASSWTTELIGIHALFGAFVFGAIMPREGGFSHALTEKLEDLVVVFLLPLFFAYSGLRTEVGLLNSSEDWLMCALIIGVACLGKFGGSTLAARWTGLSWREASALGILMNTRGLMELIVLNIGLDLGVISPKLFTMMVVMAVVTTFMTTPLLQKVYPPEELARELGEVTPPAAPRPGALTVLMCVANERSGPGMVTLASALTGRETSSQLYALRLIEPTDRASFYLKGEDEAEARGADDLAPLLERAGQLGVSVKPLSFVSSNPANDISNVAEVKGADLVLLGWHKPVLSNAVLGGAVHDIVRATSSQVAVLVDRGLPQVKRILVPWYGTEHDRAALMLARRISDASLAEVTLLHVTPPTRGDSARAGAREVLEESFPRAASNTRAVLKVVEDADPAAAAVRESREGYDLVVVGFGSEWGLESRLFGLRPEVLAQECPVSLLIVRAAVVA